MGVRGKRWTGAKGSRRRRDSRFSSRRSSFWAAVFFIGWSFRVKKDRLAQLVGKRKSKAVALGLPLAVLVTLEHRQGGVFDLTRGVDLG